MQASGEDREGVYQLSDVPWWVNKSFSTNRQTEIVKPFELEQFLVKLAIAGYRGEEGVGSKKKENLKR